MSTSTVSSTAGFPAAFHSPTAFFQHLIGDATTVGFVVSNARGKQVFPVEASTQDLGALIEAHVSGHLPVKESRRADGTPFAVTDAQALALYSVARQGDHFVTKSLVFDIDGPGHADGMTAADVQRVTAALANILEQSGLCPLVARSSSGAGCHIWVPFMVPVAAGMARWIGEAVRDAVPGAEKVEIFPKQIALRDGQLGSAITLPAMGIPSGPGGGTRVDLVGQELAWTDIRLVDPVVIDKFSCRWAVYAAKQLELIAAEVSAARFRTLTSPNGGGAEDFSDIGLEPVVRDCATIADDRVTESHVIGIVCPSHGGTCFHVAPEQGWFFCHKCGIKGAGPAAPLMLLRLLKATNSEADHRQFFAELRKKSRARIASPGTTP